MSITCTSCGTALPEGAMFCGECGRATRARNVPSKRQPAMAPPVVDPNRDTIAMDRDMLAASLNDPTLFSGPAVIPKAPAAAATPAPTTSAPTPSLTPAPTSTTVGDANPAGNNDVPASADQTSADQLSADQPSAGPAGTDVADAEPLDDGVADETDSPVDPSGQSVNSDEEQVDVALPAFHDEAVEPSEAAGFDAAGSDDAESDAAESNAAESNAAESNAAELKAAESDAVESEAAAHVEAIAELESADETEPESDLIPEPAPEAEPQPQPQPQPQPDPELESEPEPEPDVEPTAAETPAQELIAPVQSAAWGAQPSAAPALASKWGTEDWSPRTQRPGPRDPREIVRPIPAFLNRRVPVDSDVPPAPRIQAPTPPVDAGANEPAPLVQPAFTRPPAIEPATTNDPEFTTDVDSTRVVQRGSGGERFVLQFSTGESVMVFGSGLLGRNPMAQPGEDFEQTLAISDPSKSVSKTHLEFGQSQGSFWVLDRFSANGTVVREPETAPRRCEPGRRYQVVRGTRVDIGEQFFIVS